MTNFKKYAILYISAGSAHYPYLFFGNATRADGWDSERGSRMNYADHITDLSFTSYPRSRKDLDVLRVARHALRGLWVRPVESASVSTGGPSPKKYSAHR